MRPPFIIFSEFWQNQDGGKGKKQDEMCAAARVRKKRK